MPPFLKRTARERAGNHSLTVAVMILLTQLKGSLAFVVKPSNCCRASSSSVLNNANCQLSLLSFDLDDTLFPIGPVVKEANDAQMEFMNRHVTAAPLTLQEFLDTTRRIRQSLTDGPITYTELRKRAIRQQLQQANILPADLDTIVHEAFTVWLQQRHDAANQYLFPSAVPVLQQLRAAHPEAHVVAITNGRGDPHAMPRLAPFFDGPTISGEDCVVVPKRKPDPEIYQAALESLPKEQKDGMVWIHVGDCLVNDVAASADCGALSVWFNDEDAQEDTAPAWSTATPAEVAERKRKAKAAAGKSAAVITKLEQLPEAVTRILAEASLLEPQQPQHRK